MQGWQQEEIDFQMQFDKRVEDPDTPPKVYENPKDAWEIWEDPMQTFSTAIACNALRAAFKENWPRRQHSEPDSIDPLEVEIIISHKGKRRRITFEKMDNDLRAD